MKSNKSKFIWPTFLAVSLSATFGATLISCTHEDPVGIKAASYADALGKVASGDATVAGVDLTLDSTQKKKKKILQ